jgi:hypothetical protein
LVWAAAGGGKTVRVGYYDISGFIEKDESGNFSGYGVDYLNRIAEKTGWNYEYVYGTLPELFQMLDAGEIDLIGRIQSDSELRKQYVYTGYYNGLEYSLLYVNAGREDVYYDDYSAIQGMRIGTVEGWEAQDILKDTVREKGLPARCSCIRPRRRRWKLCEAGRSTRPFWRLRIMKRNSGWSVGGPRIRFSLSAVRPTGSWWIRWTGRSCTS